MHAYEPRPKCHCGSTQYPTGKGFADCDNGHTKAERAAQLAAFADKVYSASEPLSQQKKDDIRHGIRWSDGDKLHGVKHVKSEAWTVRMGDDGPSHNDEPVHVPGKLDWMDEPPTSNYEEGESEAERNR